MLKEGQEILDGRFKAIKKLGAGAFGEIFKVEKKKSGEMYAAKLVSNPFSFNAKPFNKKIIEFLLMPFLENSLLIVLCSI